MAPITSKHIVWTAGLVVGNLIGAGILALPISLGLSGLLPSLILLIVYGAMMFYSAEILARETIDKKSSTFDLPSMYGKYLGKWGKIAAVITNGIILYGLLIAYISGASQIIADLTGGKIPLTVIVLACSMLFSLLAILDLSLINRYNTILVGVLLAAFVSLFFLSFPHIQTQRLIINHWEYAPLAIPLAVTACHFHNIIPLLCKDLAWDLNAMRKAMLIGMCLAFLMNLLWTMCGIGTLPRHGDNSLVLAYIRNLPATVPMGNVLNSKAFIILAAGFSITAISTSFIANGLGLTSFIRDLLAHSASGKRFHPAARSGLLIKLLTFLPPALIALFRPDIFIKALDVVGGIGIVTLFGILPCLIALRRKEYPCFLRFAGVLFLILACFALISAIVSVAGFKPDTTRECCTEHEGQVFHMKEVKP